VGSGKSNSENHTLNSNEMKYENNKREDIKEKCQIK
jgi:hypothetical protein